MNTLFYRTTPPVSQAHIDAFTACHQQHYPGNLLAILNNKNDTECLVKCCGDMTLPDGFVCTEILNLTQARALLATPEWTKPII